jgi:hypothetical protein
MKFNFKSATEFSVKTIPVMVSHIIEHCDSMKAGDLVDIYGMSEAVSRANESIKSKTSHPALVPYKHIAGKKLWFGNKNTIAELKKAHP